MTIRSLRKSATPADWLLIGLYLLAGLVFLSAPILAVTWAGRPFPGFVVEQTLVVSNYNGRSWNGRGAGLDYPERVVLLDGRPVASLKEFQSALSSHSVGDKIDVRTISPGGEFLDHPDIRLQAFPPRDLLRLFAIPYAIGLAFLLLGFWIYRIRGMVSSGRAFAYFCVSAALTTGLFFDLITTHAASAIWTMAMALQGGALVSLAFHFPEERGLFEFRKWIRYLPFLVSLVLVAWGLTVLYDVNRPWSYVVAWRFNYFYTAFGIVFFLGMMVYRLRSSPSPIAQQQIRIILWGGLVAFIPIGVWLAAPLFGWLIPMNPLLFLPALLFFPLSVGIAIARYRMWDLDLLINRTLVYGVLTVLLGSIYLAIVVVLQQVFINLTGDRSPLAVAASTLAIALLFNPLRKRTQAGIDRRFFRRKYNFAQAVDAFSVTLRQEVNLDRLTEKLLSLVKETMQPAQLSFCSCIGSDAEASMPITADDPVMPLFLRTREALELDRLNIQSPGVAGLERRGVVLVMPLVSQGELVGMINLGRSAAERPYSIDDRRLLSVLANRAAPAIRNAQLIRLQQQKVLVDQRIGDELRVARFIQQTLLPKHMPSLPGWHIFGHYQPAQAVGGDFFDFVELDGGKLGLVIGDATGHGIPAALVMAAARSTMRTVAMQLDSPGLVLKKANDLLIADMPPNMFVTCLYAVMDPEKGSIVFANAGQNLPCHLSALGVNELMARGMPLGLMPDMEYEESQVTIYPDESVLFYSDGLVEAHNSGREMYGVPRLKKFLSGLGEDSLLISNLMNEWKGFLGENHEQEDDLTLVVLHRTTEMPQAFDTKSLPVGAGSSVYPVAGY